MSSIVSKKAPAKLYCKDIITLSSKGTYVFMFMYNYYGLLHLKYCYYRYVTVMPYYFQFVFFIFVSVVMCSLYNMFREKKNWVNTQPPIPGAAIGAQRNNFVNDEEWSMVTALVY